jgi:hypothetical protein
MSISYKHLLLELTAYRTLILFRICKGTTSLAVGSLKACCLFDALLVHGTTQKQIMLRYAKKDNQGKID